MIRAPQETRPAGRGGDRLVEERAEVLPAPWRLVASAVPASISSHSLETRLFEIPPTPSVSTSSSTTPSAVS